MNECERLSDKMPDVSLGRARWTAEEESHLAACADCGAEWRLVRTAVGLGERHAFAPDPVALAAAVEGRVVRDRQRRRDHRRVWSFFGLAAAAVLTVVVTSREPGQRVEPSASPAVAAAEPLVPLPELESLGTTELDSLLQGMKGPLVGTSTLDAPTLGDLETTELEQVLATWEG